jgi:acyl-CoA thioester hydrolase
VSLLFRHRLVARFRDCDPFGHVNHAAYLTYCEEARFTLWREQLDFVVEESSAPPDPSVTGFILARAEIDYRAQVRYGEELEVRLGLDAIGRTSFTYRYDLVDVSADRLVAAARTVLVLFDYRRHQPVPIDEALRAKLATPVGR